LDKIENPDTTSNGLSLVEFSVNRYGSAFKIESTYKDRYDTTTTDWVAPIDPTNSTDKYETLKDKYANDEVAVTLHEYNVNPVNADDTGATILPELTLNDGSKANPVALVENSNYTTTPQYRLGESKAWVESVYTLTGKKDDGDFDHDGNWSLNISDVDKATNTNVNTKGEPTADNDKTTGDTIGFVIDRTNPVVTSSVKAKDDRIKVEKSDGKATVEINVTDANLKEDELSVTLSSVKKGKTSKEKIYTVADGLTPLGNNKYSFEVKEADRARSIEVYAKDLAGNFVEGSKDGTKPYLIADDLRISSNAFYLWITDPLHLGLSIGGFLLLAGLLTFFLLWRRRRKDDDDEVVA